MSTADEHDAATADRPAGTVHALQPADVAFREEIVRQIFGDVGKIVEGAYFSEVFAIHKLYNSAEIGSICVPRLFLCRREQNFATWTYVCDGEIHLLL